ncbi:hypothetical protein [Bradyrhizobium sp. UFLA05-112]
MTENDDKTRSGGARQDRLKSALRENLKRRKAQARERAGAGPSREDEPTPDEEIAGKAGG